MIRSYLYEPSGEISYAPTHERMREALSNDGNLLWVDVEGPEDSEIELLLGVFELHPLTVEDCIMPNARPKIEEFDSYLFVVLQGLRRVDGKLRPVELDVCLGKNFIVTVRAEPLKSIEETCARVEKKSPVVTRGADFLFYAMTDSLIDAYFPILEEVEDRVQEVEAALLTESTQETMRDLLQVYNELTTLRRTLAPHREIFTRLNRADVPFITAANVIYFRDIYDHLLRMSDLVDAGRERTTLSLDMHATIVSNRLNEIMKTLTAFATLALPLVIVTGIFGMNFGENPELGPRWVYLAFSSCLIISIPIMAYFFRRNQWL